MLGPNSVEGRSEQRESGNGGWTWRDDEAEREATRCELCRSDEATSVEYGLCVCQGCEDELLP